MCNRWRISLFWVLFSNWILISQQFLSHISLTHLSKPVFSRFPEKKQWKATTKLFARKMGVNSNQKNQPKVTSVNEGGEQSFAVEYDLSMEYDEDLDEMTKAHRKLKNDHEWMFFDVAKIHVKGGDGGDGCSALRREFCIQHGGPSGGNGGHGGNVYVECDPSLNTLSNLHRQVHYKGKDGTNGRGDSRHGYHGTHSVVKVPPGTIIRTEEGLLAGELHQPGQRMLVAKGGKGGRGNESFKTPSNPTPCLAEKGEPGIARWLQLELKLIADVGLIGVPNAGKSTLLAAVSNAKPKIADYPFTTVVPNLGVCNLFSSSSTPSSSTGTTASSRKQKHTDPTTTPTASLTANKDNLVIADIPGLLEGAHAGVGLGSAFLRHIQRCRLLIHIIAGDSPDPIGDYHAINQELLLFNPLVAKKLQVVVINKIDLPHVRDLLPTLITSLQTAAGHKRVLGISAIAHENTKELMLRVLGLWQQFPVQSSEELFSVEEKRVNLAALDNGAEVESSGTGNSGNSGYGSGGKILHPFRVVVDPDFPGQYRVEGQQIERIVKMTNWAYYGAAERFQRILEAQGILTALDEAGAKQGDLIMIGDYDFEYWEKRNRWLSELES